MKLTALEGLFFVISSYVLATVTYHKEVLGAGRHIRRKENKRAKQTLEKQLIERI